VLRFVAGLLVVVFSVTGCEKQSGEAVVLAKEHIAAAPPHSETPSAKSLASPNAPTPSEERPRSIGDDEITVDSYAMRPEVRGTSRDPRALKDEQWLVKVRMIDSGRTFNVQAQQWQFDKIQEGDRVHVRYRSGKYTGTVWSAEISR
jgi:hypothetical protein